MQVLLSQFVHGVRQQVLHSSAVTRQRVLVLCPAAAWQHQTPPQHVEAPARISLSLQRLQMKLGNVLDFEHKVAPAAEDIITRVHGKAYWASLHALRKKAIRTLQSVRVDGKAPRKAASAGGLAGKAKGRGRPRKTKAAPPRVDPPGRLPQSPGRQFGEGMDGASQSSLNDAGSQPSSLQQGYAAGGVGAVDPLRVHPGRANGLVSVSEAEDEDGRPVSLSADEDSDDDGWLTSLGRLLERDTYVSPKTVTAVRQSVGAVLMGAAEVMSGARVAAFALVRPPGHHAGCCSHVGRSQGFCLVNNVMCAATEVLRTSPRTRVAVVDIDTHFGNGSYAVARALARNLTPCVSADGDDFTYLMRDTTAALDAMERGAMRQSHLEARAAQADNAGAPHLMLASIHQFSDEAYPATVIANADEDGRTQATQTISEGGANVTLVTEGVPCGSSNALWRERFSARVVAELKRFDADLVFISAGFDAHVDDPVGQLQLVDKDFQWAAEQVGAAMRVPRIVSVLEGGYGVCQDSNWSLLRGVESHVRGLHHVAERAADTPLDSAAATQAAVGAAAGVVPELLQSAWDGIVQGMPPQALEAAVPARNALGSALLGRPSPGMSSAEADAAQQAKQQLQQQLEEAKAATSAAIDSALEKETALKDELSALTEQCSHTTQQLRLEQQRVAVLKDEISTATQRLDALRAAAVHSSAPAALSAAAAASASGMYSSAHSLAAGVQGLAAGGRAFVAPSALLPTEGDSSGSDSAGQASPPAGRRGEQHTMEWQPDARANRSAVHTVQALLDAKVAAALGSSTPSVAGSPPASQSDTVQDEAAAAQSGLTSSKRTLHSGKGQRTNASDGSSSDSSTSSSGSGSSSSGDSGTEVENDSDGEATDADDATVIEGDSGKSGLNSSTLLAVAQSSVRSASPPTAGGKQSPSPTPSATSSVKRRGRPPGTGKGKKSPAARKPQTQKVGGRKRGRPPLSLSQPLTAPPPLLMDDSDDQVVVSSDSDSTSSSSSSSDALGAATRGERAPARKAPRRSFATKRGRRASTPPSATESDQEGGGSSKPRPVIGARFARKSGKRVRSPPSSSGGSSSDSSSDSDSDESLPVSQLVARAS